MTRTRRRRLLLAAGAATLIVTPFAVFAGIQVAFHAKADAAALHLDISQVRTAIEKSPGWIETLSPAGISGSDRVTIAGQSITLVSVETKVEVTSLDGGRGYCIVVSDPANGEAAFDSRSQVVTDGATSCS